jgi:hypothetical protein
MLSMFVTELTSQSPMGLIEALGILQRSEGRAAVWSERRSRSEGIGTMDATTTVTTTVTTVTTTTQRR